MLFRLNSDGSPDVSFGLNGKVEVVFDGFGFVACSLIIQSDSKILIAGNVQTSIDGFSSAIARYNPDGSLDQTFGTEGKIINYIGGNVIALKMLPDSKFLTLGAYEAPMYYGVPIPC